MSAPNAFSIFIVEFPFLEAGEGKARPVIVVSKAYGPYKTVAIVPISSKSNPESVDCVLSDWNDSGLIKPSVARTHRLTTVLKSRLTNQLGVLSAEDSDGLRQAMRKFLEL